jgi:hypothetical protein
MPNRTRDNSSRESIFAGLVRERARLLLRARDVSVYVAKIILITVYLFLIYEKYHAEPDIARGYLLFFPIPRASATTQNIEGYTPL